MSYSRVHVTFMVEDTRYISATFNFHFVHGDMLTCFNKQCEDIILGVVNNGNLTMCSIGDFSNFLHENIEKMKYECDNARSVMKYLDTMMEDDNYPYMIVKELVFN